MPLRDHGRFEYAPITQRLPSYDWPDRGRLAVYIAVNLEHFEFGQGLGARLAPGGGEPDVLNYSWREYGNRVGAWRLLTMLKELGLPVTLLVNSEIYNHCPELPKEYCRQLQQCEVVGHGKSNSYKQSDMNEGQEGQYIAEATATLKQQTGQAPRGWLGPWISESPVTPDLLQEQGYLYTLDWCHDDRPIWMKTRSGGRLLSVPYSQEVNDIPSIIARHDSARQFADMIIDQFDEMVTQSEDGPALVLGIALHPYIVGQPFRLKHLRRALEHIASTAERHKPPRIKGENYVQMPGVWLTTAGGIAEYVSTLQQNCIPGEGHLDTGDTMHSL